MNCHQVVSQTRAEIPSHLRAVFERMDLVADIERRDIVRYTNLPGSPDADFIEASFIYISAGPSTR
jgi:hypothetical protein